MTILIEIQYVGYNKTWTIRCGDLSGSSTMSHLNKKELIEEVKEQIRMEEAEAKIKREVKK